MTISNHKEAYVWVWLPDAVQPIVAGKLEHEGSYHDFFYGQTYLNNPSAIALEKNDLPLLKGHRFKSIQELHPVFCDSLPDMWGRRILFNKYYNAPLSSLDMLLFSSSDRIGALHFQENSTEFTPRFENDASLEQLMEAATIIENGKSLPEELAIALFHGTSVGGARPKALLNEKDHKYIAKFGSSTDLFPLVQAEYATMLLGKKIGLNVSPVRLVKISGKYILLVERFDRIKMNNGWSRKFIISGLTMLRLEEIEARYASYLNLADEIRKCSQSPIKDLNELFERMIFNILVGNTDDHAKNHAFFWNGQHHKLTPAYDICPYLRVRQQATQAMIVGKQGSFSLLKNALSAAPWFQLSDQQANDKIDLMVEKIKSFWPDVCEQAELTQLQQQQLNGTAILNPYCFYDNP